MLIPEPTYDAQPECEFHTSCAASQYEKLAFIRKLILRADYFIISLIDELLL